MKSLSKSITKKAKRKELKDDYLKLTMKIVISPLKRKKDSPSRCALVKKKNPQRSLVSKRRKIENKIEGNKPLKITIILSIDLETNVEANVYDIVPSLRKKVDGKRVHMNISHAP